MEAGGLVGFFSRNLAEVPDCPIKRRRCDRRAHDATGVLRMAYDSKTSPAKSSPA